MLLPFTTTHDTHRPPAHRRQSVLRPSSSVLAGRRHAPRIMHHASLASRAPAAPPALPDVTVEELEAQHRDAWGLWEGAERSVLPSGLRLVTARLPKSGSVSVALGVDAGARFQAEAQSGISHVLEHMCFRGSERWPSSFRLTAAVEEVGGTLDGYTHREATVYYSRLPRLYATRAIEIIFDRVRRPRLVAADFDVERDVVLEEIRQDATASAVVAEE